MSYGTWLDENGKIAIALEWKSSQNDKCVY